MDLSDRIAIYDGKIVGELNPKETDEFEIERLMAGGSNDQWKIKAKKRIAFKTSNNNLHHNFNPIRLW